MRIVLWYVQLRERLLVDVGIWAGLEGVGVIFRCQLEFYVLIAQKSTCSPLESLRTLLLIIDIRVMNCSCESNQDTTASSFPSQIAPAVVIWYAYLSA